MFGGKVGTIDGLAVGEGLADDVATLIVTCAVRTLLPQVAVSVYVVVVCGCT